MFAPGCRKTGDIKVKVVGVVISFVIDSDSAVNVTDRKMWEHLKKEKIKCESRQTSKIKHL